MNRPATVPRRAGLPRLLGALGFVLLPPLLACAGHPPPDPAAPVAVPPTSSGVPSEVPSSGVPPTSSEEVPPTSSGVPPSSSAGDEPGETALATEAHEAREVELCTRYLERYPDGRFVDEMRELCDDLAWRQLLDTPRVEEIRAWLDDHPDDPRAAEARRRWRELRFDEVERAGTLEACDLYLEEFPDGEEAAEVRRRRGGILWRRAEASGDAAAIAGWIDDHPESPHLPEARALLDRLRRWRLVAAEDTVAAYRRYLSSGAAGPGADVARDRASLRHWRQRVQSDPGDDHALTQLAEACLLERACTLEQMEGYYRQALAANPRNAGALLGLARIAYNRSDYPAAEELLDRALALDGDDPEAHFYRGRLWARRDDCRAAIAELDRTLELDPDHAEAYFHRGACKRRSADCRAAVADYRRVVELIDDESSKFYQQARRHLRDCR